MATLISFSSVFQALVPKDKKFLPLFMQASANVLHTAELLKTALTADSVTRINLLREVALMEKQGDEFTHVIMREASVSFIIPFDREDIQELAMALDEVVDYMNGIAKRIELYKIPQIQPVMIKLVEVAYEACDELNHITSNLNKLKYTEDMQRRLAKIADLKKKSDMIFHDAVAHLFAEESNALEILKYKEIYSFMATTTSRCEDAAGVIENILVKFS